jgi:hypothetical protein
MANVKISELTPVTNIADANEVEVRDGANNLRATAAQWYAYLWGKITGVAGKGTPVDEDILPLGDSENANVGKTLTMANLRAYLAAKAATNTEKTVLVDADLGTILDSAESNAPSRVTMANVFAYLWGKLKGSAGKTAPVDADTLVLSDSAAAEVNKTLTLANLWSYIWGKVAAVANKTAPVPADSLALVDSEAANAAKRLLLSQLSLVARGPETGIDLTSAGGLLHLDLGYNVQNHLLTQSTVLQVPDITAWPVGRVQRFDVFLKVDAAGSFTPSLHASWLTDGSTPLALSIDAGKINWVVLTIVKSASLGNVYGAGLAAIL